MTEDNEQKVELRKTSDIILSLESKVDKLTKMISLYDMNIKIILDRVNKIFAYIDELQKEYEGTQGQPADNTPVQVSNEHTIVEAEDIIGHRRTSRHESYAPPDAQMPLPVQPSAQEPTLSDKKVPVMQRVTDNTGKDLFMAEVNILNESNELVIKTKTTATGKWQAYLKPGGYTVNIVKTDTATKKKIEAMQSISVPNSNAVVTLPTAIIKR